MEMFKKYLMLNTKDYPNLGLDFLFNVFLLSLFVILALAIVFLHLQRAQIHGFITRLSRKEAKDEASAKTLDGLNLRSNPLLRYMLRSDNRLRRLVGRAGENTYTYEEMKQMMKERKKDELPGADEAKYYLRKDSEDEVKRIIETYEPSVLKTVLYIVLIFMITVCLIIISPELLSLIDGWLG